jgi:hypothetical protein
VELAPGASAEDATAEAENDASGVGGGAASAGRIFDPPYAHQTDFEFSLRLSPALDGPHLAPGTFFLSVVAAEERVSRRLRKQRRLDGEPERHATLVTVWIEEKRPRTADPRVGNPERAAAVAERLAKLKEQQAARTQFGRKQSAMQQERKEQEMLQQIGLPPELTASDPKRKAVAASEAAADAPDAESKHDD